MPAAMEAAMEGFMSETVMVVVMEMVKTVVIMEAVEAIPEEDRASMLEAIGVQSMDDLLVDIPKSLRIGALDLPDGLSEFETMSQVASLAARNRVPRLPPSAIGASPAAGGRKTWWLLMTQSCRRADYQKRSDEIMHSHNLLWRRPKMKGPRRLVRRGADQHMERRTEKKASAQEPPRSRDRAIAY